jgi:hypothetical protein
MAYRISVVGKSQSEPAPMHAELDTGEGQTTSECPKRSHLQTLSKPNPAAPLRIWPVFPTHGCGGAGL